ncbi:MAG: HAD family hydrolase [Anaerolineae bacterium]|nr:HAD family hydrolase [Anaerolineae bacterium]
MTLRGVIFDMGGTLLHYNAPNTSWEDTEKTGVRAMYRMLAEHGCTLPPENAALDTAWQVAMKAWQTLLTPDYDAQALKLDIQIKQLAEEQWKTGPLAPDIAAQLAPAYMTAIQAHVYPLDGAADTLRALRDQDLHVALISNTVWPEAAHQYDLERHGLIEYFEHQFFSADVETWKPYNEIFQMALDALNLTPGEAIYIGDSLFFDVWGAQQAGMRGVWIEQEHRWLPDGMDITPDATIKTLPELLEVINGWR